MQEGETTRVSGTNRQIAKYVGESFEAVYIKWRHRHRYSCIVLCTHTCKHTLVKQCEWHKKGHSAKLWEGTAWHRVTVLPNCPPGSRGQSAIVTLINITIRKQDSVGGLGGTGEDGGGLEMKKKKISRQTGFSGCVHVASDLFLHAIK